jgi:hypothetical protein
MNGIYPAQMEGTLTTAFVLIPSEQSTPYPRSRGRPRGVKNGQGGITRRMRSAAKFVEELKCGSFKEKIERKKKLMSRENPE